MPDLYESKSGANIEIMGYPFYAESVNITEMFNRRELVRNKILGGTEDVLKGGYVSREFSFTTHVNIEPDRPDIHNEIFREMMSKPVEVISPELGGKFKASVIVKPTHATPYKLELSIDIKEIPEKDSNILGEAKWVIPAVKKVSGNNGKDDKTLAKENAQNKELNTKLAKCSVPFKKNQSNACVKLLQDKLILKGFLDKNSKTGRYDQATINAVKKYQKSTKGKLLVDGVFGKYTLASLIKT